MGFFHGDLGVLELISLRLDNADTASVRSVPAFIISHNITVTDNVYGEVSPSKQQSFHRQMPMASDLWH